MTWTNYDDALSQVRSAGLEIDGLEVDTPKPVREHVAEGGREKRGWYWLFTKQIDGQDYITGAFGVYHGNDAGKQTIKIQRDGKAVQISADERAAIAARQKANMARLKAMRDAEAERAALTAGQVWRKYLPEGQCDYLTRKNVGAHGVRFAPGAHTMAVPMMDAAGKVWGLQLIRGKDRAKNKLEKEYWPRGLAKTGHYHLLGGIPKGVVLVVEGYATGATLHQASGLPVVIAFDAGNLRPVAEAIKKTYKRARILVCADDDYLTEGNPGVKAAENAALAIDGAVAVPIFAADREGKKLTDYNDLAALEGEATVRAQIEARLTALGWDVSAQATRAGSLNRGVGERARKDDIASVIQVDEALERFAMIYGSGGTWFDNREHMLVPKSDLQDILPEHGMRDMRNLKRVVRLDEVGFDPAGTDLRIKCNLWGGWPTEPKEGTCKVLLELLEYLCSDDGDAQTARAAFKWVLKWLAYPIQHPGAKMRTALIFHGSQGAGKNLFFETVMAIYGEYGRIVDQSAVEDKFNDWASRKLFLIADEVVARAELFHVKNKLKGIVTGEWIRINPKNVAAHDEKNHVNLVFLSNEKQPLVLDEDDRRYTVIWTPDKLPEGFYADVRAELDAGGREALHHYLLNLPLGDFDEHTKPPMTNAKRDLIEISRDSTERFIADWQAGEVTAPNGEGAPFRPCLGAHLYLLYLHWCKSVGASRPRERNQFIGSIAKRRGWIAGKSLYTRESLLPSSSGKNRKMVVPDDDQIKKSPVGSQRNERGEIFEKYWQEEGEDKAEWLTRSFFGFSNSTGFAA